MHNGWFTYVILEPVHQYVKIGRSYTPNARARAIQAATHLELKLTSIIAGDHEAALFHKFKHLRTRGEWFNDTSREIRDFIETLPHEMIEGVAHINELNLSKPSRKKVREESSTAQRQRARALTREHIAVIDRHDLLEKLATYNVVTSTDLYALLNLKISTGLSAHVGELMRSLGWYPSKIRPLGQPARAVWVREGADPYGLPGELARTMGWAAGWETECNMGQGKKSEK